MHSTSIRFKTISGMFWSLVDLLSIQVVQFVIQIFLARLLLPNDFGVIGMVTVFIALSQTLVDSGFSNALIREKESSQADYATVFYFNLGISLILYGLLFVTAPYISGFFGEPKLEPILRVLGVVIIINAFGLIQKTMLTKKIDFKSLAKINMLSSVLSGILAVVLALLGFGVWSLVIRMILMQFLQAALLMLNNKWMPILTFSMASFKKLFGFSWKLLVSGLIYTLYDNLYYLVIGKYFSAIQLGYYTNAKKLRNTASESLTGSIQRVAYPVLSNINTTEDNDDALKAAYKKMLKMSIFLIFPIMLGFTGAGKPIITLIFGEKWVPSIVYFQIICISGMLYPLHSINLNILQVKGRSDLFLKLEIIKIVIGVITVGIVLGLKMGMTELLIASLISSFFGYYINSYYSGKLLDYSVLEQLKDIMPIFISAFLMCISVLTLVTIGDKMNFLTLTLQIGAGVIIYIGVSWILKVEELKMVMGMIQSFVNKLKKKTTN